MKNLMFACFIVLAFTVSSFAKLAIVPLDEAIKDSDLIIVGTLKNIYEKSQEWGNEGEGEIFVEKFIAGKVKTGDGLPLKSGDKLKLSYVENFPCVMGSHRRIENEKGIFLLTLKENGEIQYQDFRSLESLAEIMKLLKKGVKPNAVTKTVKNLSDIPESLQQILTEKTSNDVKCLYSVKSESKVYSPFSALLVIFASISLYYFLYRSRFRIR